MSEAPTSIKNHPLPPLKLFQQTFCRHCPDQQYCNTNTQRKHLCILTLLADETARLRQLLQHRTQHLSW